MKWKLLSKTWLKWSLKRVKNSYQQISWNLMAFNLKTTLQSSKVRTLTQSSLVTKIMCLTARSFAFTLLKRITTSKINTDYLNASTQLKMETRSVIKPSKEWASFSLIWGHILKRDHTNVITQTAIQHFANRAISRSTLSHIKVSKNSNALIATDFSAKSLIWCNIKKMWIFRNWNKFKNLKAKTERNMIKSTII